MDIGVETYTRKPLRYQTTKLDILHFPSHVNQVVDFEKLYASLDAIPFDP